VQREEGHRGIQVSHHKPAVQPQQAMPKLARLGTRRALLFRGGAAGALVA
jgi:hypothetical protein